MHVGCLLCKQCGFHTVDFHPKCSSSLSQIEAEYRVYHMKDTCVNATTVIRDITAKLRDNNHKNVDVGLQGKAEDIEMHKHAV